MLRKVKNTERYIEFTTYGAQLRQLIQSETLTFVMEAHDALSAAIASEAGFQAIWASGLSISSSLGYRDANEASWTQVVDVVERMVDAAQVPVLVDGDSGFGNFNNARLLARKLRERGAAGVCLEDKGFPKMNSFVGDRHPLAETNEFCGRLKAVKDATNEAGFVLIARTEALIAGYGMQVALERAHAYAEAGADGILIHSRKADANEILEFTEAWRNRLPVVIVPTKYHTTPASTYRDARISTVIWANHNMRAAVEAMRSVCRNIIEQEGLHSVEKTVATLDDVFRLLRYPELETAENLYLPKTL